MQITIGLIIGLVVGYLTSYLYLVRVTEVNKKRVDDLKHQLTQSTSASTAEERLSMFGVNNYFPFILNLNGSDITHLICDYLERNEVSPYTFLDADAGILYKYPKMKFTIQVDGSYLKDQNNVVADTVEDSSFHPFMYNGFKFKRCKSSYTRFKVKAPDGEYILQLSGGPYRRFNNKGKLIEDSSGMMRAIILVPLDKLLGD